MAGADADLRGRRVLVVGASSGIGRAMAVAAGRRGATVAVSARRRDMVEEVAAQIRAAGSDARAWRCDVTDDAQCAGLVDDAAAWLGGIDLLVYMSGSSPLVRIADADARTWHTMLATNLIGAALVVSRALPHLRRSEHPAVIVTTHSMGDPWPWLGVYGSTKAALAEMARGLRAEEPGMRVVCVAVGNTATSFAEQWEPEAATAALEQWIAAGKLRYRVLQPDEMAGAIFDVLADDDAPDDVLIAGEEGTDALLVVAQDTAS
ncbi:MAG TPA: SDR family oxidoreductase [Acidimicrobiales bacterium]|nr:SDR family oxidoreductase [Acidimicrobiales bacterium]